MEITDVQAQRRRASRVSVYLDGEFWLGMPRETAALLDLRPGRQLDPELKQHIEQEVMTGVAVDSAARLLGYRPRSEQELRRRLEKDHTTEAVDGALCRLEEYGYVDDLQFAQQLIEAQRVKGKAVGAVRWELRRAGVGEEHIEQALGLHYPAEDEPEVAYQWARTRYRPDQASQGRLQRQLASRGFAWSVVAEVLERCQQEHPD